MSRHPRFATIALALLAIAVVGAAVVDSLGKSVFEKQANVKAREVLQTHDVQLSDREALAGLGQPQQDLPAAGRGGHAGQEAGRDQAVAQAAGRRR